MQQTLGSGQWIVDSLAMREAIYDELFLCDLAETMENLRHVDKE